MIGKLPFMLCGLILAASSATCTAAPAWRESADAVLRAALTEQRKDVTRWEMQPLLTARVEERLNQMELEGATALQLGARSSVRIRGKRDGRVQAVNVWYAVRGYRQLVVANAAIRTGAALTQSNVVMGEANIFEGACEVPNEPTFWFDTRAKHNFGPGDPICAQGIEPMPLVLRGESVAVKSISGPVTITARGVAQQDGGLGKIMRIKNPGSGEIFTAAVSGRREVVVRE
jgi:flagella basal body P-ring formation protein FlgA